ncbi:MAG: class I SAM-dependent methyltransferase, partial [Tepidisphaeraceae bacterium]
AAQRERIGATDWKAPDSGSNALDFYNDTAGREQYYTNDLTDHRRRITALLSEAPPRGGAVLEIGSGAGGLQGIGDDDYVALDYSLTALRRFVDPRWQRVCGNAERLPLFGGSVRFLLTVTALEHVPRADLAMQEVHRVLMPGGVAFLEPAWHCVQWVCDGVRRRPYHELNLRQKWAKLTLPVRQIPAVKGVTALPWRTARRASWSVRRRPMKFAFKSLRANYEQFWESDADACSRLDSHEAILFFRSRGYEILSPRGGLVRELTARHEAVVVRKP